MPALTANLEKSFIRRSSDNLGTVRDLAEYDEGADTTTIVDHYVYDAFGNETDHTGSNDFLFKYTGRAFDEETGLQNNLNRWYDPVVGRWLSEDPIGFEAGDANVYRYVGNFATGAVDPSGLDTPTLDDLSNRSIRHPNLPTTPHTPTRQSMQQGSNIARSIRFPRVPGDVEKKINSAIPESNRREQVVGPFVFQSIRIKGITIIGDQTDKYNCLGVVLLQERLLWPSISGIPVDKWEAWIDKTLVEEEGFQIVEGDLRAGAEHMKGKLKVALFEDEDGELIHVAIQDGRGGWISKLGHGFLILHPDLECVEEGRRWKRVKIYQIEMDKWLNKKAG